MVVAKNKCFDTLREAIKLQKQGFKNAAQGTFGELPKEFQAKVIQLIVMTLEETDPDVGKACIASPWGHFRLVKDASTDPLAISLVDITKVIPELVNG